MVSRTPRMEIPILISGTIGTGKSTLAKKLAKAYHARYTSASHIQHRITLERTRTHASKAKKIEEGFWESKMAETNVKLRNEDHSIDRQVDDELCTHLRAHPHTVTDARLMPWLYKGKAIRIWIHVSEKESARRVAQRDQTSMGSVFPAIRKRYRADQALWKKIYGVEYGEDLAPFDLVINTEEFEAADTYRVVKAFVDAKLRGMHARKHK
jgi:cytidylate kinase